MINALPRGRLEITLPLIAPVASGFSAFAVSRNVLIISGTFARSTPLLKYTLQVLPQRVS
jgi:hypothetical protein